MNKILFSILSFFILVMNLGELGWLCAIAKRSVGIAVWDVGVRSFKIRVVCDRCLGMWECDRLKLG
ncbi:MAG: hypothetical protein ACKO11_08485 [Cuspidothrix sp.]